MLTQTSAATVAPSRIAAEPVSVRRNSRSGVSRLRAHAVLPARTPVDALPASGSGSPRGTSVVDTAPETSHRPPRVEKIAGVHTTGLRSHDFRIEIAARPRRSLTCSPASTSTTGWGSSSPPTTAPRGAATLILATVTAFYDRLRARRRPVLRLRRLLRLPRRRPARQPAQARCLAGAQGGRRRRRRPRRSLRAINDRGITRLLVPYGPQRSAALARETLASAQRRIAGRGRLRGERQPSPAADVTVGGSGRAAVFVEQMLDSTGAAGAWRAPVRGPDVPAHRSRGGARPAQPASWVR